MPGSLGLKLLLLEDHGSMAVVAVGQVSMPRSKSLGRLAKILPRVGAKWFHAPWHSNNGSMMAISWLPAGVVVYRTGSVLVAVVLLSKKLRILSSTLSHTRTNVYASIHTCMLHEIHTYMALFLHAHLTYHIW